MKSIKYLLILSERWKKAHKKWMFWIVITHREGTHQHQQQQWGEKKNSLIWRTSWSCCCWCCAASWAANKKSEKLNARRANVKWKKQSILKLWTVTNSNLKDILDTQQREVAIKRISELLVSSTQSWASV